MAKMNVWKRPFPVQTREGAVTQKMDAKSELRGAARTCLLSEDTFYEKRCIAALATENKPEVAAALTREAHDRMRLGHAPFFWCELARRKGASPLVAETPEQVIQRRRT